MRSKKEENNLKIKTLVNWFRDAVTEYNEYTATISSAAPELKPIDLNPDSWDRKTMIDDFFLHASKIKEFIWKQKNTVDTSAEPVDNITYGNRAEAKLEELIITLRDRLASYSDAVIRTTLKNSNSTSAKTASARKT